METNGIWQKAEKILETDRYISPLIKKWGTCTIKPIDKSLYFEDLVSAICNQQLSGKAAETIFKRVSKLLGGVFEAKNILSKTDDELRACGLSYQKVKYVKDLALNVKEGKLKINLLDKLTDEEVISELTNVKGIGRWTVEMFLMFSLGRPDIFPLDDLGIKKGFIKVTGKVWDKTKAAKFAEKHWKPYRSVASWYLWRSLENR